MKNKRKLTILVILIVILLAVAGLYIIKANNNQNKTTQIEVSYAAPLTIAAAPIYTADAKGFWKDEGLNVKVTNFDSGRKALDALLSNSADVMSVSETPPLRAYLAGSKINTIATVTKHKEAKMTVRTDRITKPENIKGKTIGTVAGTNSDYYMYRWLEAHDIRTSDVKIVPMDAAALSQAFVQGSIDVIFAWEPYNYNAVSKIPNLAKSWPTDANLYSGRHTIDMNSAYLRDHSDVAERIIKGFIRAEEFIKSNPDEAKQIVMEKTGMSKDALDGLWDEYTYKVELDDEFFSILNNEAAWINANSDKKSNFQPAKLVNPTFLQNVDTGRVGKSFKL